MTDLLDQCLKCADVKGDCIENGAVVLPVSFGHHTELQNFLIAPRSSWVFQNFFLVYYFSVKMRAWKPIGYACTNQLRYVMLRYVITKVRGYAYAKIEYVYSNASLSK